MRDKLVRQQTRANAHKSYGGGELRFKFSDSHGLFKFKWPLPFICVILLRSCRAKNCTISASQTLWAGDPNGRFPLLLRESARRLLREKLRTRLAARGAAQITFYARTEREQSKYKTRGRFGRSGVERAYRRQLVTSKEEEHVCSSRAVRRGTGSAAVTGLRQPALCVRRCRRRTVLVGADVERHSSVRLGRHRGRPCDRLRIVVSVRLPKARSRLFRLSPVVLGSTTGRALHQAHVCEGTDNQQIN